MEVEHGERLIFEGREWPPGVNVSGIITARNRAICDGNKNRRRPSAGSVWRLGKAHPASYLLTAPMCLHNWWFWLI